MQALSGVFSQMPLDLPLAVLQISLSFIDVWFYFQRWKMDVVHPHAGTWLSSAVGYGGGSLWQHVVLQSSYSLNKPCWASQSLLQTCSLTHVSIYWTHRSLQQFSFGSQGSCFQNCWTFLYILPPTAKDNLYYYYYFIPILWCDEPTASSKLHKVFQWRICQTEWWKIPLKSLCLKCKNILLWQHLVVVACMTQRAPGSYKKISTVGLNCIYWGTVLWFGTWWLHCMQYTTISHLLWTWLQ